MAENTIDNIYIKMKIDKSAFDSSMTGIKREMAALRGVVGNSLLSTEDNLKLTGRLGQLKNHLDDVKKSANNIDVGDVFGNMAMFGGVAANAVAGVTGAMSLLGAETEKTGVIEKKILQFMAIGNALQSVADSKRLVSLAKIYIENIKNFLTIGKTTAATAGQVTATVALDVAQTASTKSVNLLTRATLLWNKALASNPILIIIAAIAALAAGVYLLSKAFSSSEEEVKVYEKALDGTVIKNEELRKSHNESIKVLRDLDIEYRVLTGSLTEYGAEMEKISNETADKLDENSKELAKNLEENHKGFMESILTFVIPSYVDKSSLDKDVKLIQENQTKINDIVKQGEEKRQNLKIKTERETKEALTNFRISRLKEIISSLNSEYSAAVASTQKILSLYKSLAQKQDELKSRGLTPEQKDIKTVDDYYKNYSENINDINRDLINEKENLKLINEQFIRNETLLKFYKGSEKKIGEETNKQMDYLQKKIIENGGLANGLEKKIIDIDQTIWDVSQKEGTAFIGKDVDEYLKNIALLGVKISKNMDDLIKKREDYSKKQTELDDKNVGYYSELYSLSVKSQQMSQDKFEIEKNIADNYDLKIKSQKELNRLEGEIKKQPTAFAAKAIDNTEQEEKEKEAIRIKYANQRKSSILNDENEILNIKIAAQQKIIDNEKLPEATRKKAIDDRNELLKKQISIEGEILKIKLLEVDAEIEIVNKNNEAILKQGEEKKKKLLEERNKAVKSVDDQSLVLAGSKTLEIEKQILATKLLEIDAQILLVDQTNEQGKAQVKVLESSKKLLEEKSKATVGGIKDTISEGLAPLEKDKDVFGGIFNQFDTLDLKGKMAGISEFASSSIGVLNDFITQSMNAQAEALRVSTDAALSTISKRYEQNVAIIDRALKHGAMSQEQYDREKAVLDEVRAAKEKKIKTEEAKKLKEYNIWAAIMSAAQAVASALAAPPPMGFIFAGIAAALGATQVAIIKNAEIPEFDMGGPVIGPSHSDGGKIVKLEGGEFIIQKSVSQRPGMGDFLSAVNNNQLQPRQVVNNNGISSEMIRTIISETVASIASIPVVNVESDFTKVQRRVTTIESRANW